MRLYYPNQIHPSGNIDIIISAPEPAKLPQKSRAESGDGWPQTIGRNSRFIEV